MEGFVWYGRCRVVWEVSWGFGSFAWYGRLREKKNAVVFAICEHARPTRHYRVLQLVSFANPYDRPSRGFFLFFLFGDRFACAGVAASAT